MLSDEQEVEAMAAQPAKTSETEVQDDRYSRLKHRFNALKKVGHPATNFLAIDFANVAAQWPVGRCVIKQILG